MKYLIVGASSGLGKELAKKFAEENNDLVIVSRDERDLNAIKSDLETKHKVKIDVLPLDFSSINEINDKLLSKNNLLSNLAGVMFPIGMMFDDDNSNLNTESISRLINANYVYSYTIQNKKILIKKENTSIIGFGSVSGFLEEILIHIRGCKKRIRVIL